VKINLGSRGRAPVGVWGRSLPEAERFFFHFQKVIVALKGRKRPPSLEYFRGGGRQGAAEKAGCSPRPLDPPLQCARWLRWPWRVIAPLLNWGRESSSITQKSVRPSWDEKVLLQFLQECRGGGGAPRPPYLYEGS